MSLSILCEKPQAGAEKTDNKDKRMKVRTQPVSGWNLAKEAVMVSIITIECVYCGLQIGVKDGLGITGVSSSICPVCFRKHYPGGAKKFLYAQRT